MKGRKLGNQRGDGQKKMEKTVIAEKLIDFSFLINPKWKKTCSSLSMQRMWERREAGERGENHN